MSWIVPSEEGEELQGYIFTSDSLSQHWAILDGFEGDGYRRVSVSVTVQSGKKIKACVYALKQDS